MDRNTSGQKLTFFAFTPADGLPKTGDAANITIYVSKDDGTVTALTDTSATEIDATNDPGSYVVDLTQSETNGIKLRFSGKSSTSGVVVVPQTIYTVPAGHSTVTIANNAAAANMTRLGGLTAPVTNMGTVFNTSFSTAYDSVNGRWVSQNAINDAYETVGSIAATVTGMATAAELAKVPKSDSTVGWNATARAQIQSEVADELESRGYTSTVAGRIDAAISGVPAACRDIAIGTPVSGSVGDYWYQAVVTAGAASGYAESAVNKLGTGWTGTGVNNVLGAFQALLSKTASTPSDIGGTFDPAADSTEAIRDRGDAAWVTAAGFSTLDAAGVRTAVGLGSANLDTQLGELTTALAAADDAVLAAIAGLNNLSTAQLAAAIAAGDDATLAAIAALSIPSAAQNAAAVLGMTTETGLTFEGYLRATFAAMAGACSGLPDGPIVFKSKDGNKNRISCAFDADGNRTSITFDLS